MSAELPSSLLPIDSSEDLEESFTTTDLDGAGFRERFSALQNGLRQEGLNLVSLDSKIAERLQELREENMPPDQDDWYLQLTGLKQQWSEIWQSARSNAPCAHSCLEMELRAFLKANSLVLSVSLPELQDQLSTKKLEYEEDPDPSNLEQVLLYNMAVKCALHLSVLYSIQRVDTLRRHISALPPDLAAMELPGLEAELVTWSNRKTLRQGHLDTARNGPQAEIKRKKKLLEEATEKVDRLQLLIRLKSDLAQAQDSLVQAELNLQPASGDSSQQSTAAQPATAEPSPVVSAAPATTVAAQQPSQPSSSSPAASSSTSTRVRWSVPRQDERTSQEVPSEAQIMQWQIASLEAMPSCVERCCWLLFCRTKSLAWELVPAQLVPGYQAAIASLLEQLPSLLQSAVDSFILPNADAVLAHIRPLIREQHWRPASAQLEQMCGSFTPFNFREADYLVARSKEAARLGGSIVLMLGPTGSGKSTTVHVLSGSRFEFVRIDSETGEELPADSNRGLKHFKPILTPENSHLASFVSNPEMRSETRYVNTLRLRCQVDERPVEFTLADTAGFGDTRGAELELGNTAGLVCALHAAQNCRLMILVNKQSLGKKLEGLVRLFSIMGSMLKSVKDALPSIIYVLTGFKKKPGQSSSNEFYDKAINARKNLEQHNQFHGAVAEFFNDLLKKFKEGRTFLIDPRCPDPADLLLAIDELPRIEYPAENFQFFPAPIVEQAALKQLTAERSRIQRALQIDSDESLTYVAFKLKVLSDLRRDIPLPFIINMVNELVEEIASDIQKRASQASSQLQVLRMPHLTPDDLTEFRQCCERIERLQSSIRSFLPQNWVPIPSGDQQLIAAGKRVAKEIDGLLKSADPSAPLNLTLAFQQLVHQLSVLSDVVPQLKVDFQPISDSLSSLFQQRRAHLAQMLEHNNLIEFAKTLPELRALDLPPEIRSVSEKALTDSLNLVQTRLYNVEESARVNFSRPSTDPQRAVSVETIDRTKDDAKFLAEIQSGFTYMMLKDFIGPLAEDVSRVSGSFQSTLQSYFAALQQGIHNRLQTIEWLSLDLVEKQFLALQAASTMPLVDIGTTFQAAVQDITDFYDTVRTQAESLIMSLIKDTGSASSSSSSSQRSLRDTVDDFSEDCSLESYLEILRQSSWVDTALPDLTGGRSGMLSRLARRLQAVIRNFETLLTWNEFQLGLRDHSKLANVLHRLVRFLSAASSFPELAAPLEKLIATFKVILSRGLKSAEDQIQTGRKGTIQSQILWLRGIQNSYEKMRAEHLPSAKFLHDNHLTTIDQLPAMIDAAQRRQAERAKNLQSDIAQISEEVSRIDAQCKTLAEQQKWEEMGPLGIQKNSKKQALSALEAEIQQANAVLANELQRLENIRVEYERIAASDQPPAQASQVLVEAMESRPELLEDSTIQALRSKLSQLEAEDNRLREDPFLQFNPISNLSLFHAALSYLQTLHTPMSRAIFPASLESIQTEYRSISQKFNTFVQEYMSKLSLGLHALFNRITNPTTLPTSREEATADFYRLIRELQDLEKGNQLRNYFENIDCTVSWTSFEEWKQKIRQEATRLGNMLAMHHENPKEFLDIALALTRVDALFPDEIRPSFGTLYGTAIASAKEDMKENLQQAVSLLRRGEFSAAFEHVDQGLASDTVTTLTRMTPHLRHAINDVFTTIDRQLLFMPDSDPAALQQQLSAPMKKLKEIEQLRSLDQFYGTALFKEKVETVADLLAQKIEQFVDAVRRQLDSHGTFESIQAQLNTISMSAQFIASCLQLPRDWRGLVLVDGLQQKVKGFVDDINARYRYLSSPESWLNRSPQSDLDKLPSGEQQESLRQVIVDATTRYLDFADQPSYGLIVGDCWDTTKTVAQQFPDNPERRAAYFVRTGESLELFFFADFYTKRPSPVSAQACSAEEFQAALRELAPPVVVQGEVRYPAGLDFRGNIPAAVLHDNRALALHSRPSVPSLRSTAIKIGRKVAPFVAGVSETVDQFEQKWKAEDRSLSDSLRAILLSLSLDETLSQDKVDEFQRLLSELSACGNEEAIVQSMSTDVASHLSNVQREISTCVSSGRADDVSTLLRYLNSAWQLWRLIQGRSRNAFVSITGQLRSGAGLIVRHVNRILNSIDQLPNELEAKLIPDALAAFSLLIEVFSHSDVPDALWENPTTRAAAFQRCFDRAARILQEHEKLCSRVTFPLQSGAVTLRSLNLVRFADNLIVQRSLQPLVAQLAQFQRFVEMVPPTSAGRLLQLMKDEPDSNLLVCFTHLSRWRTAEQHFAVLQEKLETMPQELSAALLTPASSRRNDGVRTGHYMTVLGGIIVLKSVSECFARLEREPSFHLLIHQEALAGLPTAGDKIASDLVDVFERLIPQAVELTRTVAPPKDVLDEFNFVCDELRLLLSAPAPPQINPLRTDGLQITLGGSSESLVARLGNIKAQLDSTLLDQVKNIKLLPDGPIGTDVELQEAVKRLSQGMVQTMKIADRFLSIRSPVIQTLNTTLEQLQTSHKNGVRSLGIALRRANTPETNAILSQFEQFRGEMIYQWNVKQNSFESSVETVLTKMENDRASGGNRNTEFSRLNLENRYKCFHEYYELLVKQFVTDRPSDLSPEAASADLLNIVLEKAAKLPKTPPRSIIDSLASTVSTVVTGVRNMFTGQKQTAKQRPRIGVPSPFVQAGAASTSGAATSSAPAAPATEPQTWPLQTYQRELPELIAGIFALWTASASSFFENSASDQNYLLKPKPVQVLSVFRMLGIGTDRETAQLLPKNMVEIKTGEGKSVTLAVTAAALALLGYDVSVSCYSEFLMQRDRRAFESLFNFLRIQDYVHYGTFTSLCEDEINCNGDVRSMVKDLLFPDAILLSELRQSPKNERQRILLIDEVDVFFRKDFFGNEYLPAAKLTHPTINALFSAIWQLHQDGQQLTLAVVKRSPTYGACLSVFPDMAAFVDEAIKDMASVIDEKEFTSPPYVVQDNRIAYIEDGTPSFRTSYGYKTAWAYFQAWSSDLITRESLDANVGLLVQCGRFSFAEIPKSFASIIGVTGTLSSLNAVERQILQYYEIDRFTFAPSMYPEGAGAQVREWLETDPNHLKIIFREPTDSDSTHLESFFNVILNELRGYLRESANGAAAGAALVFFEDEATQAQFSQYEGLRREFDQIRVFSEKDSHDVKEKWVREAAMSGQLSIVPRSLGRGTDFSCEDPLVIERGGVLVIQAFLSKELSEEIQIRGRCGRQGQPGKYRMVLLGDSLQRVGISEQQVEELKLDPAQRYQLLNNARNDYFIAEYGSVLDTISAKRKPHLRAVTFLGSLACGEKQQAVDFLTSENLSSVATVPSGSRARTLVLVDGTISMGRTLHAAKVCVSTMFDAVKETLREHGVDENFFQLQFAVYRNYNVDATRILQFSGWESDSKLLSEFLDSKNVKNEGGMGREAIELAFKHAVSQITPELKQILLIGDAAANTREDVVWKRNNGCRAGRAPFGEDYWEQHVGPMTTAQEQLDILKAQDPKIPIHAFWVADADQEGTQDDFNHFASETGGQAAALDTNSPQGAAKLTEVVGVAILSTHQQSATLVQAYKTTLARVYT